MRYNYTTMRMKCLRFVLIAATATLTNPVALIYAQTAAETSPMPQHVENAQPAVAGVNHVLKATYISTCLPGCTTFSIAANTAVPLDAVTTISCPAPIGKTCTITDDASRGSHTIQTQAYSLFGANASGWTATYRVYVP